MIELERINFENGTLVKPGYVEIDGVEYNVIPAKYTGKTPFNRTNLNKLQDNIESYTRKYVAEESLIERILLQGNSIQEGTPSIDSEAPIESVGDNIQLFDKDNVAMINAYINTNGTTANSAEWIATNSFIPVEPNTEYIINALDMGSRFIYSEHTEANHTTIIGQRKEITPNTPFTTSSTAKYIRFCTNNSNANDFKLEKGTKATPYSPYGQGSIEIYNVNKNLFDKNDTNKILSAIPDGNTLKINSNSNGRIFYIKCKPSTNYTISKLASKRLQTWDSIEKPAIGVTVNSVLNTDYAFSGTKKTVKTSSSAKYLVCYYYNSSTDTLSEETIRNSIQLEEGEIATEYVEGKSQTKALYTQQPFRAIGDVKDRFVKQNGVWYEEHKIAREIFDGTETFTSTKDTSTGLSRFITDALVTKIIPSTKVDSNYFVGSNSSTYLFKESYVVNPSSGNISFCKSGATVSTDFKTWLTELYNAGTPVYVDYVLATPTLILCTPEQVEVLNDIYSAYGEGMTNIICNDEIEPVIEIVKETKETVQSENDKAISMLLARIEELEKKIQ